MKIEKFTNDQYIPLQKLKEIDNELFIETQKFRRKYTTIILNDLQKNDFIKLVETPELIKKRYIKNVELSGIINIRAKDSDIILHLAKEMLLNKKLFNVDNKIIEDNIKSFKEEGNDITILTTWIIKNIDKCVLNTSININQDEIRKFMPDISVKDESFLNASNNKNSFYSINNYMEATQCSYETARISLDKLANLDLFKKSKKGKRFLYQPTQKLTQIIKGGTQWT